MKSGYPDAGIIDRPSGSRIASSVGRTTRGRRSEGTAWPSRGCRSWAFPSPTNAAPDDRGTIFLRSIRRTFDRRQSQAPSAYDSEDNRLNQPSGASGVFDLDARPNHGGTTPLQNVRVESGLGHLALRRAVARGSGVRTFRTYRSQELCTCAKKLSYLPRQRDGLIKRQPGAPKRPSGRPGRRIRNRGCRNRIP
jgi:hypothetical protein